MYVDGEYESNVTSSNGPSLDSTNRSVVFGCHSVCSDTHFTGTLDEISIWNLPISASEVFDLYDNYAIPSVVGHWTFNETAGTNAYDDSDNGNNGTLMNGPTWTTGVDGNAIQFDGSNDYVQIENSDSDDGSNIGTLLGDGSFSASLWYKASANPGSNDWDFLIDQRVSDNYGDGWYIFNDGRDSNKLSFVIADSSSTEVKATSSTQIATNIWYHVAVTYNGTHSKLYINGVLENTTYSNIVQRRKQ